MPLSFHKVAAQQCPGCLMTSTLCQVQACPVVAKQHPAAYWFTYAVQVRNLCLGLAARGVEWRAQGGRGSLEILGRLVVRLFGNLFQRSEKISQAMVVRGFLGPEQHHLYLMQSNETTLLGNMAAMMLLVLLCAAVAYIK